MNSPIVSVIVPNYNHARYLSKRLESVLRQTFQDWELILLDDCSTDDSRSVIARYATDPRVRIEFNETNSGSTFKQWNRGVRLARGEYVWIAESDDSADSRLLETLMNAMSADDDIVYAYCRSWKMNEGDQTNGFGDWHLDSLDQGRWKRDFVMDGRQHCRLYSVRSPVVANSGAAVFRREVYESVGGADEALRLCGDWKLWAAMALKGKVAFVNQPLNFFRYHDSTVRAKTRQDALDVQEKLSVISWILSEVSPTEEDRRHAWEEAANHWVPALMSLRVRRDAKLALWARVRKFDPQPWRRFVRPAASAVRRKLTRGWAERNSSLRRPDSMENSEGA